MAKFIFTSGNVLASVIATAPAACGAGNAGMGGNVGNSYARNETVAQAKTDTNQRKDAENAEGSKVEIKQSVAPASSPRRLQTVLRCSAFAASPCWPHCVNCWSCLMI
jgi:hypothetical protein